MKMIFFKLILFMSMSFPLISIAQSKVTGLQASNQFDWALQESKTLNLKPEQINKIKGKNKSLNDSLDFAAKQNRTNIFNRDKFIHTELLLIITDSQYNKLIGIKSADLAKAEAIKRWNWGVEKNATAGFKKEDAIKDLTAYFVAKWIIWNKYKYDELNQLKALKNLDNNSPDSLKILAKSNLYFGANMASQFGLAISNKHELGLSNEQLKQLIKKAKEMSDRSLLSKQYPDSIKSYNHSEFESLNMRAILSPAQYEQVLNIKNKKRSLSLASKDWEDITARNLSGKFNKDSAMKVLSDYYLKRFNAADYYACEPEKLTQQIRLIDSKEPEPLKVLRSVRKGNSAKPSSGLYEW